MLSQQPDVRYLGHPFVSARPAQFKSLDDPSPSKLSSANEAELRKAWDAGLSEWQEALDRAKKAVCSRTRPRCIFDMADSTSRIKSCSCTRTRISHSLPTSRSNTSLMDTWVINLTDGPYGRVKRSRTSPSSLTRSCYSRARYLSSLFAIQVSSSRPAGARCMKARALRCRNLSCVHRDQTHWWPLILVGVEPCMTGISRKVSSRSL